MSSRPSPLQNRVAPDGTLVAEPARGLLMGNRGGQIHAEWRLTRRQASRRWIACKLCFKGRQRRVWQSGYTELFFLDEATALAAGHRPCFECRRAEARAFAAAWAAAEGCDAPPRADAMDRVLAAQRGQAGPACAAVQLPQGAIFAADGFWLCHAGGAKRWSPQGYGPTAPLPAAQVTPLTPPAILAVLREGYRPMLHPSAAGNG
ncbi:MAG: hypothetical protein AAFR46_19700 [Pseudomonadota bacterium]